jgi:hypothetical protein
MQQQLSVITLGISDLARSKRFYADGFGWTPVFENDEIAFYQMNGFVLGTWLQSSLEADMRRNSLCRPGAFALAHNAHHRTRFRPSWTAWRWQEGASCGMGMRRLTGDSGAISPIQMTMHGRLPGTRPGRSMVRAGSRSEFSPRPVSGIPLDLSGSVLI